jgi:hypothetical protein
MIGEDGVGIRIGGLSGGFGYATKIVDSNNATVNAYFFNGELYLGNNATPNLATLSVKQAAKASDWTPSLRIDPGAHTSMTAATAFPNHVFTAATQSWVAIAGTIAAQKDTEFRAITHSAATSGTFTDLYNVFMEAPAVGGAATAGSTWALGLGGALSLTASTTTRASMRMPHGVAPTSPVNGDIWTTAASVYARISGVTVDLAAGGGTTVNEVEINFGTTEDTDIRLFVADAAITANSKIVCSVSAKATADHRIDDIVSTNIVIFAGNVQAGSGFTVYAKASDGTKGRYKVNYIVQY